jgi:hypothetical protein
MPQALSVNGLLTLAIYAAECPLEERRRYREKEFRRPRRSQTGWQV